MSQRQWKKLDVIDRVTRGLLTSEEAAEALGISERQVRRLRRRIEAQGSKAVVHGNTGRPPWNRIEVAVRDKIVDLRRYVYKGQVNDSHFTEKLVEVEKVVVSRSTVRRILRAENIASSQKRRARKHRRRRERRAAAGQMILWDGSPHAWLEDRGPELCLMAAIDDATAEVLPGAHFVDNECAAGYLQLLKTTCREKGIPLSAYMDRHGSLHRNTGDWTLEEELTGERQPTQVGAALKALEIEPIFALSPQAKGRVERLWKTLQDRLVAELRFAGASTKDAANALLPALLVDHNRRFAVPPAEQTPVWRKLRAGTDLDHVCAFHYRCSRTTTRSAWLGESSSTFRRAPAKGAGPRPKWTPCSTWTGPGAFTRTPS